MLSNQLLTMPKEPPLTPWTSQDGVQCYHCSTWFGRWLYYCQYPHRFFQYNICPIHLNEHLPGKGSRPSQPSKRPYYQQPISQNIGPVVCRCASQWFTSSKYGPVVQQLLAGIKTLTMPQVTVLLRLEAASMATDKARFKDVYAAKMTKHHKFQAGNKPKDLFRVHPNGQHSNSVCFQQKEKTTAGASNSDSMTKDKVIKRYNHIMDASRARNVSKPSSGSNSHTAASATTVDDTIEDQYITYSAHSVSIKSGNHDINQFLLDTGANTHIACNPHILHDVHLIRPVYVQGIAETIGRVTATQQGSVNISCTDKSGNHRILEIKDVLLVPESGVNLLAVSSLRNKARRFSGDNSHIKLVND